MRLPILPLTLCIALSLGAQTPTPEVTPAETPAPGAPAVETPLAVPPVAPETPVAATEDLSQVAVVLVYREKRFAGAILNTSVFIDDVEVADMDNGTYLKVRLTPGEHRIHADEKKDEMTLLFEAGKTYYFRMALRAGLWKGHGKLEPVDEGTGQKEFTSWKAKLVYAKDVRKPEMVILD